MNWKVHKTEGQPFIKVVTKGEFNLADHLRMIQDIISRDFWKPGANVLFDNRNLEFVLTDISVMREAVSNHKRNNERIGDGKSAILMKSLTDFGRGRQFELLAEGKLSARLRIFRDEKEAIDWLTA